MVGVSGVEILLASVTALMFAENRDGCPAAFFVQ
jgi:hypothetical protein